MTLEQGWQKLRAISESGFEVTIRFGKDGVTQVAINKLTTGSPEGYGESMRPEEAMDRAIRMWETNGNKMESVYITCHLVDLESRRHLLDTVTLKTNPLEVGDKSWDEASVVDSITMIDSDRWIVYMKEEVK